MRLYDEWTPDHNDDFLWLLVENGACCSTCRDALPEHNTASYRPGVYAAWSVGPSGSTRTGQRPHQLCDERCVLACGRATPTSIIAGRASHMRPIGLIHITVAIRSTHVPHGPASVAPTTVTRPIGPLLKS